MTRRVALLLLVLPLLALTLPLYFSPFTLFGSDEFTLAGVLRNFLFSEILEGRFPWWNPYYFGGYPFAASPVTGTFYPFNYLPILAEPEHRFLLLVAFHQLLFMTGFYLFARSEGFSEEGSVAAALSIGLGGWFMGKVVGGHPDYIFCGTWIPFLLWSLNRLFREGKSGGLFLFLALFILSGAIQLIYLSGMMLLAYALFLGWEQYRKGNLSFMFPLLLEGGKAFFLLLPVLYLFSTATGETFRANVPLPFDQVFLDSFPLGALALFLNPNAFGTVFDGVWNNHYPTNLFWEIPIFMGWLPLAAFGFAVLVMAKERDFLSPAFFWMLCGIFFLTISFGNETAFSQLLFHIIPGLDNFRVPARALVGVAFALAFLLGWAITRIGKSLDNSSCSPLLKKGIPLLLVLFVATQGFWYAQGMMVKDTHIPTVKPFHRDTDNGRALPHDNDVPNRWLMERLPSIGGYDPMVPYSFLQLLAIHEGRAEPINQVVVLDVEGKNSPFTWLHNVGNVNGGCYFSETVQSVGKEDFLASAREGRLNVERTSYRHRQEAGSLSNNPDNTCSMTMIAPNAWEVEASVSGTGFISFSLPFQESLRGEEINVSLEEVNFRFTGAILPEGTHRFTLRYGAPPLFLPLCALSFLAFALLFIAARRRIQSV